MKPRMIQFNKNAQAIKAAFQKKLEDPQAFHLSLLEMEQFCRNWRLDDVRGFPVEVEKWLEAVTWQGEVNQ